MATHKNKDKVKFIKRKGKVIPIGKRSKANGSKPKNKGTLQKSLNAKKKLPKSAVGKEVDKPLKITSNMLSLPFIVPSLLLKEGLDVVGNIPKKKFKGIKKKKLRG